MPHGGANSYRFPQEPGLHGTQLPTTGPTDWVPAEETRNVQQIHYRRPGARGHPWHEVLPPDPRDPEPAPVTPGDRGKNDSPWRRNYAI
jgi:hypothetical protein